MQLGLLILLTLLVTGGLLSGEEPRFQSIDDLNKEFGFAMISPDDIAPLSIRKCLGNCRTLQFARVGKRLKERHPIFGYEKLDVVDRLPVFSTLMVSTSVLGSPYLGTSRPRYLLTCKSPDGSSVDVLLSEGKSFWDIEMINNGTGEVSRRCSINPQFIRALELGLGYNPNP